MKERTIKIPGFTYDTTPDDKPAVDVFGEENTGKTRFACTAPCENGVVGYIAIDKNAKRTVQEYKDKYGLRVLINTQPMLTDKEALGLAMRDSHVDSDLAVIKKTYSDAVQRVLEHGVRLAESPDVESIVLDNASQLFDWIMFSHFGRRNQIDSFLRGAPNQDMIDFIQVMRPKNLVMISRGSEIWKDTGEVDNKGRKKQAPSGNFKPDGFGKLGYLMTAVVQLTAKRKMPAEGPGSGLDSKYRVRVQTAKGNTLLEGQDLHDYGVSGENITWSNLMTVLGIE